MGVKVAGDDRAAMTGAAPLVLHVFPSFAVGGAQVRFAAIANHFGNSFRHIVVSLDGNLACRERLDDSLSVVCPPVVAPKGATFTAVRQFRHWLRRWRPDVLVTCNWGAIEWAMADLPRIARHIHIEDGFGPEERAAQLPRRALTRRIVLARSTVVLPSRTLWRIATETWRLSPQRVRYIPNGIDLSRFALALPTTTPSSEAAVATMPVIGTVAALRAEKNLPRLLQAFARLTVPARLVIVGDGPDRVTLEALVQSLAIADRVEFAGHQDNPAPFYARFDVFALSSDTEQMPLSVIEAMAGGLPVATTDVGDVRSMLAESNRPFVGPLDVDALGRSLSDLLADAALRRQIGAENRAKACRDFDQAAMFGAYGALLRGESLPSAV